MCFSSGILQVSGSALTPLLGVALITSQLHDAVLEY